MATETLYAASLAAGDVASPGNAVGAPDGTFTTDTGNTSWTARYNMDAPSDALQAVTQSVAVRVRTDNVGGNVPTITVNLYDNGALVRALATDVAVSTAGQDVNVTFDGSEVSGTVTIEVVVTAAGGSPQVRATVQLDAITWTAEVEVPLQTGSGDVTLSWGWADDATGADTTQGDPGVDPPTDFLAEQVADDIVLTWTDAIEGAVDPDLPPVPGYVMWFDPQDPVAFTNQRTWVNKGSLTPPSANFTADETTVNGHRAALSVTGTELGNWADAGWYPSGEITVAYLSDGSTLPGNYLLGFQDSVGQTVQIARGVAAGSQILTWDTVPTLRTWTGDPYPASGVHTIVNRVSQTDVNLLVNGSGPGPISATNPLRPSDATSVLNILMTGQRAWGDIILWPFALTDQQMLDVHNWLVAKWAPIPNLRLEGGCLYMDPGTAWDAIADDITVEMDCRPGPSGVTFGRFVSCRTTNTDCFIDAFDETSSRNSIATRIHAQPGTSSKTLADSTAPAQRNTISWVIDTTPQYDVLVDGVSELTAGIEPLSNTADIPSSHSGGFVVGNWGPDRTGRAWTGTLYGLIVKRTSTQEVLAEIDPTQFNLSGWTDNYGNAWSVDLTDGGIT